MYLDLKIPAVGADDSLHKLMRQSYLTFGDIQAGLLLARLQWHYNDRLVRMKIDQALLEAALVGYLRRRDEVAAKIVEIQQELGGAAPKTTSDSGSKTREMSAAARERIAAAQRKRWAAYHKTQKEPAQKRRLSPAARKRIADATKKRWAAYRAQKAAAQA